MAKISLRTYDGEIESLIERAQRLDEAVADCRHILKTYPKHLETYRLMGKAYLEAKRYNEAVDIFQRVLMAAPDDFVAHVGMGIIADEQNKLDESIWHMERAFEVQPSNAAIQGELKRLIGRREGVEPPKIRLTRGALAHMYVQGDLFAQAISEIRAVLSNDPKRSDMRVLLAKAYYRNGQKAEASDICSELLTRYPYCLDANRLMVEILTGTEQTAALQDYRQRVIELDPYAAFVEGSVFDTKKVPDSAVSLEKLDYTGQLPEASAPFGIGLESESAAPVSTASQPARTESGRVTEEPRITASLSESAPAAVQGDLPEWVKALAPAGEGVPAIQPAAPISESPSQLADIPEWLRNLGGDQPAAGVSSSADTPNADSTGGIKNLVGRELDEPEPESMPSSNTDWLTSLKADQPSSPDVAPEAGVGLQPPNKLSQDWLKEFDSDLKKPVQKTDAGAAEPTRQPAFAQPSANLASVGATAEERDDSTAWLDDLAAKQEAKPEEQVTGSDAHTDTAPLWVDKANEIDKQAPESVPTPSESADGAPGILPGNRQPGEVQGSIAKLEVPEPLDLRRGLADQNDFAVMGTDGEQEETPIMNERDTRDSLSNLNENPAEGAPAEGVPDWLHGTPADSVRSPSTGIAATPSASESAVDIPEWLASLEKADRAASASAASSEDLPSWLQAEVEPEPRTTEPTRADDWQPVGTAPSSKPVPESSEANQKVDEAGAPAVSISQAVGTSMPSADESAPLSTVAPEASAVHAAAVPPMPAPAPVATKITVGADRALTDAASLDGARSELGRGNIAAALDNYGKLIRKGKSLDEIIRDLLDALHRSPAEVPIWQALGDAYMRANRLQDALDAYTKAEERLR